MTGTTPHIITRGLTKTYTSDQNQFTALKSIDLTIDSGEMVAITGASGSGKSTLLNMISGIDRPTQGNVTVGPTIIDSLTENEAAKWRGTNIGVVFQFFQLLLTLTIVENVMLPMDFNGGTPKPGRPTRALELLDQVGIADQANKRPSELSGGQQQRAAIARSLANDPALIVADEPTGNLDSTTSTQILDYLKTLANHGKTVVVVTHDHSISSVCRRVIEVSDGEIYQDSPNEQAADTRLTDV